MTTRPVDRNLILVIKLSVLFNSKNLTDQFMKVIYLSQGGNVSVLSPLLPGTEAKGQ